MANKMNSVLAMSHVANELVACIENLICTIYLDKGEGLKPLPTPLAYRWCGLLNLEATLGLVAVRSMRELQHTPLFHHPLGEFSIRIVIQHSLLPLSHWPVCEGF